MCQRQIIENLIAIATAYGTATGKSRTSISKEFYGRGDFLENLQAGAHSLSLRKIDQILRRFRAEWPDGATWPDVKPILMTQVAD